MQTFDVEYKRGNGVTEVAVDECSQVQKCIYWSGELDDRLLRLAALSIESDGMYYNEWAVVKVDCRVSNIAGK